MTDYSLSPFRLLQVAIALDTKISVEKITDNPGLIPLKLGQAKLEEYTHTLLHFYDLNPIIEETNKLYLKSSNLTRIVSSHTEYSIETSNYFKILSLIQGRVEGKLAEIIPHPQRTKRGLINIMGSVFKSITGNLDSSDGERYENLIKDLQNNQIKLASYVSNKNSVSLKLIDSFNKTINKLCHNEQLLENKINQIGLIVQKTTFKGNADYIKDTLIQIINLYEVIDSVLQDVGNAVTFSKIGIFHPSIIKTQELHVELLRIGQIVGISHMPLGISLENTLLYERIIKVESFILNNRVTFLLHIPITSQNHFDYFHLYSVPIYKQGLFKVIIPKNKFLVKNKLHFSYRQTPCQKVRDQLYICDKMDLQQIDPNSPCAVQLLEANKEASNCQQVEARIAEPIVNQLESSNKWILVLPKEENIQLLCTNQDERIKVIGTHFTEIPEDCKIKIDKELIINYRNSETRTAQPILFPDLTLEYKILPALNLTVHLGDVKLDDLQLLRNQIAESKPDVMFNHLTESPKIWTILIYVVGIIAFAYYIHKKIARGNCTRQRSRNPTEVTPNIDGPEEVIHLPRQTV